MIGDNLMRDLLHQWNPKFNDKTSSACNRRLRRRLRSQEPKHDFYIEKLWNDQHFQDTFSPKAHEMANMIAEATKVGKRFDFQSFDC